MTDIDRLTRALYIRWPDGWTDAQKLEDIKQVIESLDRTRNRWLNHATRKITRETPLTRRWLEQQDTGTAEGLLERIAEIRKVTG